MDAQGEIGSVVEVAEGGASRGNGIGDARSGMHRYIFEPPVTQVAIEKFALGVSGLGLQLFDLGIDVAVADQDVGPAVVVEIEKAAAPAEIFGGEAESGGEGGVLEAAAAEMVI